MDPNLPPVPYELERLELISALADAGLREIEHLKAGAELAERLELEKARRVAAEKALALRLGWMLS